MFINAMAPNARAKATTVRDAESKSTKKRQDSSFQVGSSPLLVLTAVIVAVIAWQLATWPKRGGGSVALGGGDAHSPNGSDCSGGARWEPEWLARVAGRDDAAARLVQWLEAGGVDTSAVRVGVFRGVQGLEVGGMGGAGWGVWSGVWGVWSWVGQLGLTHRTMGGWAGGM